MAILQTAKNKTTSITRRQFLLLAGISAAGVALVAQASIALYQFLKPGAVEGSFGSSINAGNPREFKVGSVETVREMHGFVSRLDQNGALVMSWLDL